MVAKTLEAQASTGQTGLTVSAYPIGTDTVATQVSAAAATEATNRLGWYTCTADDLAAGDYQIKVLSSGGVLVASWMARIAGRCRDVSMPRIAARYNPYRDDSRYDHDEY